MASTRAWRRRARALWRAGADVPSPAVPASPAALPVPAGAGAAPEVVPSCGGVASPSAIPQPPHDLVDDLLDRHVARVQLERPLRDPQRGRLPPLVEGVAAGHVGGDGLVVEPGH